MNTIDTNARNSNVSFGIAFKLQKNKLGKTTSTMLDLSEELKMYDNIKNQLKKDKFVKTEYGIKSDTMALDDDYKVPHSKALRYKDETGEYFFFDNKITLRGVQQSFKELRESFEKIFNS